MKNLLKSEETQCNYNYFNGQFHFIKSILILIIFSDLPWELIQNKEIASMLLAIIIITNMKIKKIFLYHKDSISCYVRTVLEVVLRVLWKDKLVNIDICNNFELVLKEDLKIWSKWVWTLWNKIDYQNLCNYTVFILISINF